MSATVLLNRGRVSTKSIANSIQNSRFLGLVDHEPKGAQYKPSATLRNMQAARRIVHKRKPVTDKIAEIDKIISNNENYIYIGWTNISWADFFNDRWGNNVNFLVLVRCPYETSLSLLTHGFFPGRRDIYARAAMINPSFKMHFNELRNTKR